jgi:excisionase family DNA binding protein
MTNPEPTQKRPSLKELLASGDLISPEELAAALKIARVTAYQWVRRGAIPHLKIEGVVRFDPQEVEAWLESKRRSGAIPPPGPGKEAKPGGRGGQHNKCCPG